MIETYNFTNSACNETAAASCNATVTLQNANFSRLYTDIDVCIDNLEETTNSTNVINSNTIRHF